MRILQVTPGYPPTLGGVERHVRDLCRALRQYGHEVAVASADGGRGLPARDEAEQFDVYRFATVGRGIYRFPVGLYSFLRRHAADYDIVHAHSLHALPLPTAVLAAGRRTVVTPHFHGHGHTPLADALHRAYIPLMRRVLRWAGGVVCDSSGEADLVARALGVSRAAIAVVPSIVELPEARDMGLERSHADPQIVLFVGRLEPYKRVDRLVGAMPFLAPATRLVVVGDGPMREALIGQAAALGLGERVRFLGSVGDAELRGWYRLAAVVATFSEAEAFGRTVVEALAYGCRVVCSDLPPFREFARCYPGAVSVVGAAGAAAEVAWALAGALAGQPRVCVDLTPFTAGHVARQIVACYEQTLRWGGPLPAGAARTNT